MKGDFIGSDILLFEGIFLFGIAIVKKRLQGPTRMWIYYLKSVRKKALTLTIVNPNHHGRQYKGKSFKSSFYPNQSNQSIRSYCEELS